MIVGPTNGGKSVCYNMLKDALTDLRTNKESRDVSHQVVEYTCLNPKSITMGELFGLYDQNTGDWKDGLASSLMREYSEREDKNYRWVVFDGPVDAKWIENMNTVLDDNMMPCLANSERIKLKKEMRMLFEV
jgi:dynein heavy chain